LALGTLAHVSALRRTRLGGWDEKTAVSLETLTPFMHSPAAFGYLRPLSTALDGIPALAVLDNDVAKLRQGQTVLLRGANAPISEAAVLIRCDNQPIAIGEISQGFLKTKRLFNL